MTSVVRFIGALLVAIVAALVVFIWMSPGTHADQGLAAAAAQARGEAKKWQTNAALVQIELTGFGFASRPSGIPDMTHAGPPRLAMIPSGNPIAIARRSEIPASSRCRVIQRSSLLPKVSETKGLARSVGPKNCCAAAA